ncbi:cocaine- and amphetamine-regulated transcript 4 isoform X1 [Entelurus aequoreus]|uniref:cocaine- and amphetamine-regulated transcript 4 isoform X1 n=1 Tax=Entelurus aequoreus TaxID=161455 RepID=UPI002B1D9242|nr:cocaine- and amphetamine-regulated transcript 4 isoform X1 [Entelurus aequoreus]
MSVLTLFIIIIIIMAAGGEVEVTSSPDYDYDYNATFGYIFYSNTSSEDLETFLKNTSDYLDSHEDRQDYEEEVIITTTTKRYNTPRGGVIIDNTAPSCVCLDGMLMMAVIVHHSL